MMKSTKQVSPVPKPDGMNSTNVPEVAELSSTKDYSLSVQEIGELLERYLKNPSDQTSRDRAFAAIVYGHGGVGRMHLELTKLIGMYANQRYDNQSQTFLAKEVAGKITEKFPNADSLFSKYDADKGKFMPWFRTVLLNELRTYVAAARKSDEFIRHGLLDEEKNSSEGDTAGMVLDPVDLRETPMTSTMRQVPTNAMIGAVNSLPKDLLSVWELMMKDLTDADAAKLLDVSVATWKRRKEDVVSHIGLALKKVGVVDRSGIDICDVAKADAKRREG
jgi:DNA-directed RNA polymerase specialized sigma24 family protein